MSKDNSKLILYSSVKLLFDCPKVTLFIFNKRLNTDFFEKLPLDKQRYIHAVNFHDAFAVERTKIMAISRTPEELCEEVLYSSVVKIHKDSIRKKEQMAVCIRQHKRGGELSCIL